MGWSRSRSRQYFSLPTTCHTSRILNNSIGLRSCQPEFIDMVLYLGSLGGEEFKFLQLSPVSQSHVETMETASAAGTKGRHIDHGQI